MENSGIITGTDTTATSGFGGSNVYVGATGSVTSLSASESAFDLAGKDNDVVNHGQIIGDIQLDESDNDLLNTGTITGSFAGGDEQDEVTNSGTGAEFTVSDPNVIGRVKIYIDTDGDGTADMKIVLNNVTTALTEDNFLF